MPKNVIIVGMARSGTSLTASVFVKQGYFVTDDPDGQLQAASPYNHNGFWELEDLKDADAKVFSAVGFPYHNTWTDDPIEQHQAEAIFELDHTDDDRALLARYDNKEPWMWKDPRLCYTLAYWWRMMDADTTAVLLVTRDPKDVWRSFQRINWGNARAKNKSEFIRRIKNHIAFARETIKRLDIPHVEIDYSDYARDPDEVARKLSATFDLELSREDLGYESKYNHSGVRGSISYWAERLSDFLPAKVRRTIKTMMPGFLWRAVFPAKSK